MDNLDQLSKSIVDTLREPLLILDATLRVSAANRSFYRLFQTLPESTVDCLIYDLASGQWNIPRLRHLLEDIIPHNAVMEDFEVGYDSPEIGHRVILLNARRIESDGNLPALILLAIEDITEKKAIQDALEHHAQELARSNADLQQFAYVASHDLQEPLRMVTSYLALIERRYGDKLDQDGHEFIAYAVDGAKRMQALINDLLDYSRVGRNQEGMGLTDIGLKLQQSLTTYAARLQEMGAEVTSDPLPTVYANPTEIRQVFANLIGNALKFHSEQPVKIHVSARLDGDQWIFSVSDNGIGIEPEYFERIFQIFQRLHQRADYAGTGIGLAIVKKIILQHGGTVWVESQPGRGSTFYFTLPNRNEESADGR